MWMRGNATGYGACIGPHCCRGVHFVYDDTKEVSRVFVCFLLHITKWHTLSHFIQIQSSPMRISDVTCQHHRNARRKMHVKHIWKETILRAHHSLSNVLRTRTKLGADSNINRVQGCPSVSKCKRKGSDICENCSVLFVENVVCPTTLFKAPSFFGKLLFPWKLFVHVLFSSFYCFREESSHKGLFRAWNLWKPFAFHISVTSYSIPHPPFSCRLSIACR